MGIVSGNVEHGTRYPHFPEMLVIALGILSITMLVWTDRINRMGDSAYQVADAIMDLQKSVAMSHILLEEGERGDRIAKAKAAQYSLDQASSLCDAILFGGETEYGQIFGSEEDPNLQAEIGSFRGILSELKAIIQHQYLNPDEAGSVALWDLRYDQVSNKLMERAVAAETKIEKRLMKDRAESRLMYYAILFTWTALVAASGTGLYRRERQRRAAEIALRAANSRLSHQTGELSRHREHLTELVEERTIALQASNSELHRKVVERREAEEALRRSEERYRVLVETMNEGLTMLDGSGVINYANDRLCAMLRCSRSELLGQSCIDLVASERDKEIVTNQIRRLSEEDRSRCEITIRRDGHQSIFAMVSFKGMYGMKGDLVGSFAVITDITEKAALQTIAVRTAHLASLGEMAAGVAHEINNPVNGIINYARMLSDLTDQTSQEHDLADRTLKEGRRIAEIVRSLLLFARGGKKEKMPVGLGEILSSTFSLVSSQLKKDGIETLITVPTDLPDLIADPHEIQQVFMNIISNARDALNEGYPQRHENKILQIQAHKVAIHNSLYVRIAFCDRGVGIPSGIIDKIREPFFSTKPRGKGTGLGLSISEGIISEHGGKLSIESKEGEFTSVVVDLPVCGREDAQHSCDG